MEKFILTIILCIVLLGIFMMLRIMIQFNKRKSELGAKVSSYYPKLGPLFLRAGSFIFASYFFGGACIRLFSRYHEVDHVLFIIKAANYIGIIFLSVIITVQSFRKTEVYEKGIIIDSRCYSYANLKGYSILHSQYDADRIFLQEKPEKEIEISSSIQTKDIALFEEDIKQFVPSVNLKVSKYMF